VIASIEEPEVIAKTLAHRENTAPDPGQAEWPLTGAGAAPTGTADLTPYGGDCSSPAVTTRGGPGAFVPELAAQQRVRGFRQASKAGSARGLKVLIWTRRQLQRLGYFPTSRIATLYPAI